MTCVIVAGLVRHSLTDYGDCLLINQKRFTILIQRLTCYSETHLLIHLVFIELIVLLLKKSTVHRFKFLFIECRCYIFSVMLNDRPVGHHAHLQYKAYTVPIKYLQNFVKMQPCFQLHVLTLLMTNLYSVFCV